MKSKAASLAAIVALMIVFLPSCGREEPTKAPARDHPHPHEHKPKHGGTLVEYDAGHLEFTLDGVTGTLTAYSLDGEVEDPVVLRQPELKITITRKIDGQAEKTGLTLKPTLNPLTHEIPDKPAQYSVTSETLKGVKEFDGVVESISVNGKTFTGISFNFPRGNED